MKKSAFNRRFVSSDQAIKLSTQHTTPCADCPFARTAIKGWLGSTTVEEWLQALHGEARVDCHTTDKQCAGAAIYRANVHKSCRNKTNLTLPPDTEICFASPDEFKNHHQIHATT